MDLAGGMSKLSPALVRMSYEHRSIRQRQLPISSESHTTNQISKPTNAQLARAEAAYLKGSSLKVVAKQVGIGHERLAKLLRNRGVRLRRQTPTETEILDMQHRYEAGASLERVGLALGYSAGTVRNYLLSAGTNMRDTHGRESVSL